MKLWKYWRLALITTSAIALSAKAAFAMPPAIGILGTLGTSIAAGASATQIVSGLFVAALSYAAQTVLGKMLAPDVKTKGIKQKLESGGDNPLSFILGEYVTAGKLTYVNQDDGGDKVNNKLCLVISLSELPVTSFSNFIYINGEKSTIDFAHQTPEPGEFDSDAPGPGFYRVTDYDKRDDDDYNRQYCWVKFYDGTQTTADDFLLDTYGADPDKPWTSDMVGRGCAYAIVVCRYSDQGIWSGVPEFKFVVRGIKLYDPRKDSSVGGSGSQRWRNQSTWAFSENPKVMQFNILKGLYYSGDWVWGGQSPKRPSLSPPNNDDPDAYRYPLSYWFAAMNHCDEDVELASGDTIKRYTAGCEIHVDQQPIDVIKELDKSCTGYTAEYGGMWKTWAGPPGSPVLTINDKDIIITEEQSDNLFRPSQELYNGAHATYVNQNAGWVMKDAPPRVFDDLVEADGGYQFVADIQLPYVTNGNQAQRLMRIAVLDSRRQITHTMTLPPEAYVLEPFDVDAWNSDRNGYSPKRFQITSIDDQPNCNQLIAKRETNPSDYDWDVSYELPETVGPLKPSKPGRLALDFTVSADQVDRPGGGKDKPAILIQWTWGAKDIDLDYVKWEVRRSASQPKVVAHGTFFNTEDTSRTITSAAFRFKQSFQVRLFAKPVRKGRLSTWTGWKSVTMVDMDVPGAPTLTRVSDLADDGSLNFFVDIDWTAVSADVQYAIRIVNGLRTYYRYTNENAYRLEVTSGVAYQISVRALGADGGTPGDWSSATSITVTKKNTAPSTPSGLTATGDNHRIRLAWTKSPDSDFKRTIIYRSNTNDFTAASEVGRTGATRFNDEPLANGVTRYYWITHEDRSSNESAKHPTSNTAGVSATTLRVVDDDTDPTQLAAPTGLAISQDNIDLDKDGRVDTAILVAWNDFGATAKSYEVEISQSATSGGTYTVIENRKSKNLLIRHPAKATKFYKARVRAFSFNGTPGTWSSLTAAFQPASKSAAPSNVAWESSNPIVAKPKAIWLRWQEPSDADYKKTVIYRNTSNNSGTATEVGRVSGTRYKDDDDLVAGTTYYYWAKHLDQSGNLSASFSSVQSVAWKLVGAADLAATDLQNLAPNGDFSQGLDGWKRPIGTVTWINGVGSGPSQYAVKLDRVTTENSITTFDNFNGTTNDVGVACNSGDKYVVDCWVFSTVAGNVQHDVVTRTSAGALAGWNFAAVAVSAGVWTNVIAEATVGASGKAFLRLQNVINNSTLFVTNVRWLRKNGADLVVDGTIVEKLTDQTAPNAPTVGALSSITGDIDLDGSPDTGFQFTVTAPGSGPAPKFYEVEVQRAAAQGSSGSMTGYAKIWSRPFPTEDPGISADTLIQVQSVTNKWFKARVRCVSFSGRKGAWSAFQNLGFQPSGYSNTMPTVAWQGSNPIVAKPKAIWLRFLQITLATYPQAKEIVVYRNTSNNSATATEIGTAPPGAQRYQDNDDLTPGTTYYYWLKVRDRQNAVSASFSSVQSVAWKLVEATDTGSTIATASAPTVSQVAKDLNGDGVVDMALKLTGALPSGATSLEFEVDFNVGGSADLQYFRAKGLSTRIGPVIAGKQYSVKVRGIAFNEDAGALSSATTFTPAGKTGAPADPSGLLISYPSPLGFGIRWAQPSEKDYLRTDIAYAGSGTVPPANDSTIITSPVSKGSGANPDIFVYWPRSTSFTSYLWVRHVNQSRIPSNWICAGLYTSPGVDELYLADDAVANKISAMTVGDIGTYAFLKKTSAGTAFSGDVVSGLLDLVYTDTSLSTGANPGLSSWQCMGRCPQNQATLWLRIS